jgi:hypothetical protein
MYLLENIKKEQIPLISLKTEVGNRGLKPKYLQ